MAKIKEISEATGYSLATVSKALRGSSELKPETISKIRDAAKKLDFDDTKLRNKICNVNTIGVVFMELCSEYYNGIFDSFKQKMENEGYRIVTMLSDFDNEDKQLECIKYMIKARVSGLMFLTELDISIEKFRKVIVKSGIPTVMITRHSRIDFCDVISVNHSLGVKMAVEYLHSLGHEKIAYIGEKFTTKRQSAFIDTMARLNLSCPDEYIICSEKRYCEGGYASAKKILSLPKEKIPTAVFAAYDHLAYGAMKAFKEAGLLIPDDISIIGVDNNQLSEFVNPTLSSVKMPIEYVGRKCAEILISRIKGSSVPFQTIYLAPEIIKRKSTK